MTRRVVVTGGAGFLGSHVCERLLGEGYEVICVDNFSTGSPRNVRHLLQEPAFQMLAADVRHGVPVAGAVDAVLHLASPASPTDYLRMPIDTLETGSIGTLAALRFAREKGARFLISSTSESYGDPIVYPQPESYWGNVNPFGPRAVYDESKRFAEAATMAYRRTHGVDTAIARIFNTFGPRMRPDDGRALPIFVRQASDGAPLTVAGTGEQTRSLCYVDDLVTGLLALLHSDLPGPVNLGNPRETTVLELALMVRRLAGSPSAVEFVERPVDDPQVRRRPDITLARTALGWKPRVALEEGIRRTVDWFVEARDRTARPGLAGASADTTGDGHAAVTALR